MDRRSTQWRDGGVSHIWQSYSWSAGATPNAFRDAMPMFASAFLEYCLAAICLDLSPGASARNSAPEHLRNTTFRWHEGFADLGHRSVGLPTCKNETRL